MPDLPRRRPPSSSWAQPIRDRLTPVIKVLVIAQTVVFAFYGLVPPLALLITNHLALGPEFFAGEIWQPFTSLFVHADWVSWALDLVGLWFVGAFTERTHGQRRFLWLYFGAGVLSNLLMAAVAHFSTYQNGQIFFGPSGAIMALFIAFGRSYGRAQTQVLGTLFLEARTLSLLLLGFAVVSDIYRRNWAGLAGTLGAAAFGYFWAGGSPRELFQFLRGLMPRRGRRRYQVLDGGQAPPRRKTYIN
jgi:membrane associated rhomboid family serine protease